MFKSRLIFFGALALLAAMGTPLRAQGTTQVQLAFGYECGDRFIVRNEGTQPVLLEYAAAESQDRSQLHLNGNQSAEIASAQNGNVELWVGGKVVASEPKGNRACIGRGNAPNGDVVVRPLDQAQAAATAEGIDPTYSAPPVVVYAQPDSYYPYAFGGFYPYSYYPSVGFYGFGGYGFGGYARGGFGHGGIGRVGGGGRTGGRGRGHR
jgi:hypothetical protein